MALTDERIRVLYQKYIADIISTEERAELMEGIRQPRFQQLLRQLLSETLEQTGHTEQLPAARSAAILRDILGDNTQTKGVTKPLRRQLFRRMIAAAVVFVLLGVFAWFWLGRQPTAAPVAHDSTAQDVSPGTQGAVLTLSDGRKIALDSSGNAVIHDAAMRAILKDGRLKYEGSGDLQQTIFNTVTTSNGKHFELRLPDGTGVWLNSASSITYPLVFDKNKREVKITGEVYFEVTKSKTGQPFIVQSKQQQVTVLGTRFNVNCFEDVPGVKTTLLEGSVRVGSKAAGEKILEPGQQSIVSSGQPIEVRSVNLDQVMAWKTGSFNFTGLPFQEVMQQLSRWYNIDVKYDGSIPDLEFEGKLNRNVNLSTVLNFFKGSGIKYRMEGQVLVIVNR